MCYTVRTHLRCNDASSSALACSQVPVNAKATQVQLMASHFVPHPLPRPYWSSSLSACRWNEPWMIGGEYREVCCRGTRNGWKHVVWPNPWEFLVWPQGWWYNFLWCENVSFQKVPSVVYFARNWCHWLKMIQLKNSWFAIIETAIKFVKFSCAKIQHFLLSAQTWDLQAVVQGCCWLWPVSAQWVLLSLLIELSSPVSKYVTPCKKLLHVKTVFL